MSFQDESPLMSTQDDGNVLPTSNPPAPPALPGTATPSGQATVSQQQRLQRPHFHSFQLPMRKNVNSSGKVAIPRQTVGSVPRQSRRVPRACESCRQRKTKCSGDTPVCRQCKELRISCTYPVSWRERTNQQLDDLAAKAREYENILLDIENTVDGRTSERIKDALDKHAPESGRPSTEPRSNSTLQDDVTGQHPDDITSPSSIGSLEAIERVEEDLNRNEDTRATGYMGKNSEVTWMQRLRREAEQRSKKKSGTYEPNIDTQEEYALHAMNYHLDDMGISVPGPIHVYQMPPRPLADTLFNDYLTSVHPFFPIISRPLFTTQYQMFFDKAGRPGDKWLAILNLIFAISAKCAHLKQAPWRGDDRDHLMYFSRARILSMNGDVLFSHPDLQQVQVEGLISYYLLASDQINRAWRIAALAVRSAITLGINMKNTSTLTASVSKEARYRVWWCLYTFEHMLGIMTGRATCILDGVCTTPLPLPFEGDQLQDPLAVRLLNDQDLREEYVGSMASTYVRQMSGNPSGGTDAKHTDTPTDVTWLQSLEPSYALCFLYYADLAVISQEIVNRVYSPTCAMTPWAHIENRIGVLKSRIDLWHANLHKSFDFTRKDDEEKDDPSLLRGKLFLAFHYYSARITLGRPCLCRRDAHLGSTGTEKPSFSHTMAEVTLESASQMLSLIPDQPDAIQLYEYGPWWCVLHYLMQAVTVLLLELSFGSIHVPDRELDLLASAKKGVRWLHCMSEFSIASRRAWQLCDLNLRKIAVGMDYDVSDLPSFVYGIDRERAMDDLDPGTESGTGPGIGMRHGSGTGTGMGTGAGEAATDGLPDGDHTNPDPNIISFANTGAEMIASAHVLPYGGPLSAAPEAPGLLHMDTGAAPGAALGVGQAGQAGQGAGAGPGQAGEGYFPYDPIHGEFMKSFFPAYQESHDDHWGS